jgi:hypothetical protein
MGMKSKRLADLLILTGLGLVVTGIALIFPPAAFIAGGIGLAAFGALAIEVKP